MPLAIVAIGTSNTRRSKTIKTTMTPSGTYPTGGDPIDLTTITNPTFQQGVQPGSVPTSVQIDNTPAGFAAEIVAGTGTNLATSFKLKVYSAPGVELANAAYPAGLLADSFLVALNGPNWGF